MSMTWNAAMVSVAFSFAVGLVVGALQEPDPCRTTSDCEVWTNVLIDGMQYPLCSRFGESRIVDHVACAESRSGFQ